MLYDDEIDYGERRKRDSDDRRADERGAQAAGGDRGSLDPQDLLEDLTALLDAGLIVPVRDRDGQVRVTPAEPLAWEERSCS